MTSALPKNLDINLLKKQVKILLKQFRNQHADAIATVNSLHPKPENFSGLRDARLVVSRKYGFADWFLLSSAVEAAQLAITSLREKADLFIQLGCLQYNGNDTLRNVQRARDLLKLLIGPLVLIPWPIYSVTMKPGTMKPGTINKNHSYNTHLGMAARLSSTLHLADTHSIVDY